MALLNFDATNVAPDTGFEVLPEGWYNFIVAESEVKPTKDADTTGNAYLQCQFKVVDGQYAGRLVFVRYNIKNHNQVAQDIGFRQLSALAHAVGVLNVQDSQQLHNIPFKAKLKIRKGNLKDSNDPDGGRYDDSNEVVVVKGANEYVEGGAAPAGPAAPTAPAKPAATTAQPAAVGGAPAQPWNNPVTTVTAQPAPPPFAAPAAPAPAAPPAPVAPPIPATKTSAELAAADGWLAHPTNPAYMYRGSDVKLIAEVEAMYPVQTAVPAAPEVPAAPAAPEVPAAPQDTAAATAATAAPPWVKK